MVEFLGVIELGTLYNDNIELAIPTKPWATSTPISNNYGNITNFDSKLSIGNTSNNALNKLKWIKIKDGNKIILICDRVIAGNVSWDSLNNLGLIFGKEIKIDGGIYSCRSINTQEWNRFIGNADNIVNLPKSSAVDQFDSQTNKLWNWFGIQTICQDKNTEYDYVEGMKRPFKYYTNCIAGGYQVNYITTIGIGQPGAGWRPVLEVINSAPLISGADGNLGDKNTAFSILYQVNDVDTDSLTVLEKLNGNVLRNLNNAPKNQDLAINITSEKLYSLPLNQLNTITIQVDDGKGGIGYRNYTFRRTNTAPIISNVDKDLGIVASMQEKYTVTDMESNATTIVEKLDNTVMKTFNVELGKEYTINLDKDTWIRLSNGQHKYTIEATDSNNSKSNRVFSFTKKEFKIDFTLAKPFTTDIKASKILFTPYWDISGASKVLIEACNNAYDEKPCWEDITKQVMISRHYNFTNNIKTGSKWGVNLRVQIEKDPSYLGEISIKGFGGAFE